MNRPAVRILGDLALSPRLAGGERRACAFGVTCTLSNGDLICCYRRGKEKHSLDGVFVVQRSEDEGRSWSEPAVIYDRTARPDPQSVHGGAVGQATDGTVVAIFTVVAARHPEAYIFSETGRSEEQHLHVARSRDGGRTWSKPEVLEAPNTPRLRYINTRPLLLPDGDLLVAMEVTTADKQQATMTGRYDVRTNRLSPLTMCAEDPTVRRSFGDAKMALLPDGRVFVGIWTFLNGTEETISLHASYARPETLQWTFPEPLGVSCQNFAIAMRADGSMVLVGNVRHPPEGIRLWRSPDAGRTWDQDAFVQMWDARLGRVTGGEVAVPDAPVTPEKKGVLWASLPGFTFGGPDLVAAHDGTLVLTYYSVIDGFAEMRVCRFALA